MGESWEELEERADRPCPPCPTIRVLIINCVRKEKNSTAVLKNIYYGNNNNYSKHLLIVTVSQALC